MNLKNKRNMKFKSKKTMNFISKKAVNKKLVLDKQDMMNICRGAGFFASGGGGSVKQTHDIIENIWKIQNKKDVVLYSPDIIEDDAWLASAAIIGSPVAITAAQKHNWLKFASINSLKELAKVSKKDIEYLVAVENGSLNITIPMLIAAIEGIPYVDCTGTPRSVPQLQDTTYAVGGIDASPAAFANDEDEKDRDKSAKQYLEAEGPVSVDALARNVIEDPEFSGFSGFSNFIMTGEEMKKTGSLGCVTMSKELGEALDEAKNSAKNPFEVIRDYLKTRNRKSYLLGKGTVEKIENISEGGFDKINITIRTKDDLFTVVALNENLIVWSDKKSSPIAMAPDLISYVGENYQTYSNADIEVDKKIMLIVSQSTEIMRQAEVIEAFMEEINKMGYYGLNVLIPADDLNV